MGLEESDSRGVACVFLCSSSIIGRVPWITSPWEVKTKRKIVNSHWAAWLVFLVASDVIALILGAIHIENSEQAEENRPQSVNKRAQEPNVWIIIFQVNLSRQIFITAFVSQLFCFFKRCSSFLLCQPFLEFWKSVRVPLAAYLWFLLCCSTVSKST